MTLSKASHPSAELFSFNVFSGSTNQFLECMFDGRGKVVGYLNAHTVNLALDDEAIGSIFRQFDLLYADGMSLVKTSHKAGRPLAERINAGDFLPRFLWKCASNQRRVALVGSEPSVAEQAAQSLTNSMQSSPVCFTHHGYFDSNSPLENQLLDELQACQPHFILLGMGTPRQESFALRLREEFPDTVIWCVGALFEYYVHRYRAPVWVRQAGLEWCVRLALEPRRMTSRYLIGNLNYLQKETRWLKSISQ